MNRSRWTVAILLGLVVLGLGIGGAAFLNTQSLQAQVGSLPNAAAWMPSSASIVGYANMTEIMESPLSENWLEQLGARPDAISRLEEFKDATGMDPLTDFYAVSFSAVKRTGSVDNDGAEDEHEKSNRRAHGPEKWGVVLHGEFDPDRIIAKMEEHLPSSSEVHRGTRVFVVADKGRSHALAFPSTDVALFGEPSYVRSMLDVGAGAKASIERTLSETWGDHWLRQSSFWVTGSPEEALRELWKTPQGKAIPPVQSFALSGRLDAELSLVLKGKAEDQVAAQKLADVVRGFVALGSLQQEQRPEITELLNSVQIGQQEQEVSVSVRVPYESLRQLNRSRASSGDDSDPK